MAQKPSAVQSPQLIVFAGLPGVGKTVIARALAREIGAVYLRIDSIEGAVQDSAALVRPINDAGYRVAYALAEDNLQVGRKVVADCVNPVLITRNAWREVAARAGVRILEIEIRCSDVEEHRRRVESRACDIPGLAPPGWNEVQAREYESWDRDHMELDIATNTPGQIVDAIRGQLEG